MVRSGFSVFLLVAGLALPGRADTVVATRPMRAGDRISEGDVTTKPGVMAGALTQPDDVLGKMTVRNLFSGQALFAADVREPSLVTRNQIVTLYFTSGTLRITAVGRAMDEGPAGAMIRVLNLDSKKAITGTIMADGTVKVEGVGQ